MRTPGKMEAHDAQQDPGKDPRSRPLRVGELVRVRSQTKPLQGATGIIRAVEHEGWRLAPYYLYRVEHSVGLVDYEYGELELLCHTGRTL